MYNREVLCIIQCFHNDPTTIELCITIATCTLYSRKCVDTVPVQGTYTSSNNVSSL